MNLLSNRRYDAMPKAIKKNQLPFEKNLILFFRRGETGKRRNNVPGLKIRILRTKSFMKLGHFKTWLVRVAACHCDMGFFIHFFDVERESNSCRIFTSEHRHIGQFSEPSTTYEKIYAGN